VEIVDASINNHIGLTENDVKKKFGQPQQTSIHPARDYTHTLGCLIYKKYSHGRLDTEIMEMCYELGDFEQFFWLENKHGNWRVVKDAQFRKDIDY
jgi:hypothetical protein